MRDTEAQQKKEAAPKAAEAAPETETAAEGFFPGCRCPECPSAEACKAAYAEMMASQGIDSCGMLLSAIHKEGDEEKLHLLMMGGRIPAGAKPY